MGGHVGPDLSSIGTIRSGRDILAAIVLPSSSVVRGFENYTILTRDGLVLNGVISQPLSDVVVLREASGAEVQVPASRIQEMRQMSLSLMPEGLERSLPREEFQNLLAFLQSLKW
jgi:putative heme-binding domain-containing protein